MTNSFSTPQATGAHHPGRQRNFVPSPPGTVPRRWTPTPTRPQKKSPPPTPPAPPAAPPHPKPTPPSKKKVPPPPPKVPSFTYSLSSHPMLFNVIVPRVGSVLRISDTEREAFVGGSNRVPTITPETNDCRRPANFYHISKLEVKMEAGTEFKLSSALDDSKDKQTTMIDWLSQLANTFEELGLDTVFCIPNATWTEESYILEDWGSAQKDFVPPWIAQLKAGVYDPRNGGKHYLPCQYDMKNLKYSSKFILNSLTPDYRKFVLKDVGHHETGPMLLCHLLLRRVTLQDSKQRE